MSNKCEQCPKIPSAENKRCPIMFIKNDFSISILTMENAHHYYQGYPMVYIPLRDFMKCGGVWSALSLCTVFWEPPLYGIERDPVNNERIKGAYLIEFASDLAPICKKWAKECIQQCNQSSHEASNEVFVQIILFNEVRKAQITDAISRHNLNLSICEATILRD